MVAGVQETSSALVSQVGLEGICMVEFKTAVPEGPPVLMEINARPWGSISLPITCGIDYPGLWVDWLLTGKLPPDEIEYKKGITCRRLVSERTYAPGTHLSRHTSGLAYTLSRFPSNLAEDFGAVVSRYALRRCLVQRSFSRGRRSGTLVR